MTPRQSILRFFYPLLMAFRSGKAITISNETNAQPSQPIYHLEVELNSGEKKSLQSFQGKKLLIVNTASDCGYTTQLAQLEALYQTNKDRLAILAFPSNDFKNQEKANDAEIADFCRKNFGVSFLISKKTRVIGRPKHPVYEWLSNTQKNGWNQQQPRWNFSKYLINEAGVLTHYFDAAVSPLDHQVAAALNLQA